MEGRNGAAVGLQTVAMRESRIGQAEEVSAAAVCGSRGETIQNV